MTCQDLTEELKYILSFFDSDKDGLLTKADVIAIVDQYLYYGTRTKEEAEAAVFAYENNCNVTPAGGPPSLPDRYYACGQDSVGCVEVTYPTVYKNDPLCGEECVVGGDGGGDGGGGITQGATIQTKDVVLLLVIIGVGSVLFRR